MNHWGLGTFRRSDEVTRRTRQGTPKTVTVGKPEARGSGGERQGGLERAEEGDPCSKTSDDGMEQQQW